MTDADKAAPWYIQPLERAGKKHPDVAAAARNALANALATVSDSKPISKTDIAKLSAELIAAQRKKAAGGP